MVNTYFSYMLVIFINVYKGKGYGVLAANIGSTMKPSTGIISNSLILYSYFSTFKKICI